MSFRVEEWPVAPHMALWHSLLAQTREAAVSERSLAWRYLENPHGVARAWVLLDASTGEAGGFTVVMPRRMQLGSRRLTAWIGADFSILPRFRALGPALQLRRAAREAIDRGEADLLYAFPNMRMVLIHERAGHVRLGDLRRYARPAALTPHLKRAIKSPLAGTMLAPPAAAAWRMWLALRSAFTPDRVVQVASESARSFDAGAVGLPLERLVGAREPEYIRWRYAEQPDWRGGVFVAQRKGTPTGYLVFTEDGGLLQVSDLVAIDETAATSLLEYATAIAARRGLASVSYVGLERGIWDGVLAAAGFRQRDETHAVFAYVPERHATLIDAREPARWHLTVGDRDI